MAGSPGSRRSTTRRWSSRSLSRTAGMEISPPRLWRSSSSRSGSESRRPSRPRRSSARRRERHRTSCPSPAAARGVPDDQPRLRRPAPPRPRDPGLRRDPRASRNPFRGLDHRRWPPCRFGDAADHLGGRGTRRSRRGSAVRLPNPAQDLLPALLRDPGAARLSPLFRDADREREVVDPLRVFPVSAGGARKDRHGAPGRLSLRKRGRRPPAALRVREARRHRRNSISPRLPSAGPRARAHLPAAPGDRALLRRASTERLDRHLPGRRRVRGRRLVLSEGLSEAAHLDFFQSRPGRPEVRLPGAPVQDRRRLGGVHRQRVPLGHAEPASVSAGATHRFHLRRDLRGVGLSRSDPRARTLCHPRSSRAHSRRRRARPRGRLPDPRAYGRNLLLGDGERVDDDRTAADDGNPTPARLLRRLLGRDDLPFSRAHSRRPLSPVCQRVRRELLVNVTPPETRVALTEEGRVVEVFHERRGHRGLVGNVYLGRVHRVLPGMQAAFVSIGLDKDAFLYVEDALPPSVEEDGDDVAPGGLPSAERLAESRPRIDDLVKEGQELVVQVTKDPLSGKGPRVTAGLSLPGRTLVYLPSAREIGISRRIAEEPERERLRKLLEELPGGGGLIARTAAAGAGAAELAADRRYLLELADRITRQAERATAPALLHRELDLALRVVTDFVSGDFARIRVDDEPTFARLTEFLGAVAPGLVPAVEISPFEPPLFEAFGIEEEIAKGLRRHVDLPSGGSIVIQQTEALVAIDVNTGKFVGKDALEDTVYQTNLEAIPEIARQIRLRDLGGLLVVDFIDMAEAGHRRSVFEKFEAELAKDRARTRILQLSE